MIYKKEECDDDDQEAVDGDENTVE